MKNEHMSDFTQLISQSANEVKKSESKVSAPTTPIWTNNSQICTIPIITSSTPAMARNLDSRDLVRELLRPIFQAMGSSNVNTIHPGIFCKYVMSLINNAPSGFNVVKCSWCDEHFLETTKISRDSYVYESIVKAASLSPDGQFSVPVVAEKTLTIDIGSDEFSDPTELKIQHMSYTFSELERMNYSFIKSLRIDYNDACADKFKEAHYKFEVSKEILEREPFSKE